VTPRDLPRSRLRAGDLLPTGTLGLRTRRLRALLSGLGIAIGIAAIVSVLGVTRSSQSDLLAEIEQLGTDLLTVASAQATDTQEFELPPAAAPMIRQVPGVRAVAPTARVPTAQVYRNDRVPSGQTGARAVRACDDALLPTLGAELLTGRFLDPGPYPVTVLGYSAATTLGVAGVDGGPRVWLGEHWYVVVGILKPVPLAPEIDRSALVSFASAAQLLDHDGPPSRVYLRADPDRVTEVAGVLHRAANPVDPRGVEVSRPSDALTAQLAVEESGAGLFLGLGAIALLVGAIGIANVTLVSVLERIGEIGLRRALGAGRHHIAGQFLLESTAMGLAGGFVGASFGTLVIIAVSAANTWTPVLDPWVPLGAPLLGALIGLLSGTYPALRAAALEPVDALRAGT